MQQNSIFTRRLGVWGGGMGGGWGWGGRGEGGFVSLCFYNSYTTQKALLCITLIHLSRVLRIFYTLCIFFFIFPCLASSLASAYFQSLTYSSKSSSSWGKAPAVLFWVKQILAFCRWVPFFLFCLQEKPCLAQNTFQCSNGKKKTVPDNDLIFNNLINIPHHSKWNLI